MRFTQSYPAWFVIHSLLQNAQKHGGGVRVARHLVGAVLQRRFPDMVVGNAIQSTVDVPRELPGHFVVGNTAILVTKGPSDELYQKCQSNIEDGYQSLVIVPIRFAEATRVLAEMWAPGRITVNSIESFVGQNIDELSRFSSDGARVEFGALLRLYNERVNNVELDKSIMIELPLNL